MNTDIFREYDIRGVADRDLTDPVTERIGKAFGTYVFYFCLLKNIGRNWYRSFASEIPRSVWMGDSYTWCGAIPYLCCSCFQECLKLTSLDKRLW